MHGIDQINIVAHTDLQFTYKMILCDLTLYTHQATYSISLSVHKLYKTWACMYTLLADIWL